MHTPTPWEVSGLEECELDEMGGVIGREPRIEANDGTIICEMAGGLGLGEVSANAYLIVRAVNSYDALVAALERISAMFPADCEEPEPEDYDDTESAYNNGSDVAAHEAATIARAALATTKGGMSMKID